MSERSEKLFAAIGEVRDELVDEAAESKNLKRKRAPWLKYGGLAAVLALAVGVGVSLLPRMGEGGTAAAAYSGSDGSTEFMSYAGPVFPLTLAEENGAVTAERAMTLDFASWVPVWIFNEEQMEEARANGATEEDLEQYAGDLAKWYPEGGYYQSGTDLLVTDEYVLTNSSDTEQTVEVLYPYVSTLREYLADKPTLTVDGGVLLPEIAAGGYSGGFRGAGGEDDGQRYNLDQPTSWEQYRDLLADGSYQAAALGEFLDWSDIPVTVYTFADPWGPEESDENPNPSIRVMFDADSEKTTVLSYGFHMGWNSGGTRQGLGFSIPKKWRFDADEPYYIIVLGDDLENMDIRGYNTGGWDTEVEVEVGVNVTREETDLDTALRRAAELMYADAWRYGEAINADFELYYGLMCDYLLSYGVLSDDPAERYDGGWLDTMDFDVVDRVFYLVQEITVPAQGSVTVTTTQSKEESFDYHCAGTENQGVSGYDAVTTLGSNLSFISQRAKLEDRGQIAIVRENFGFDLDAGVTEVELDLNTEHYYLEVKRSSE